MIILSISAKFKPGHCPGVRHKRLMLVARVYQVDVPLLHLLGVLVSWRPDLQAAGFIGSRVVFLAVLSASAINDKLSRGGKKEAEATAPSDGRATPSSSSH